MKMEKIPYEQTGLFSRTVIDYISQRDDFKEFYNRFPSLPSFEQQVEEKRKNYANRAVITEVIRRQYDGAELSESQQANLKALTSDNTFTVTTGHQLCLFSGPLYFIFKICAAIKLAERLSTELKSSIVPVFWMASEDHDLEEVDHTTVFGKEVKWNAEQSGAVGRMKLKNIDEPLSQLKDILGNREEAAEILAVFNKAYSSEKTLTEATRDLVQSWFGEYGLLCVDGDDVNLKRAFQNFTSQEIFSQVVEQSSAKHRSMLAKRGLKVQATPREINLFYLKGDERKRLVPEGPDVRVVDTDLLFDADTLKATIEKHPERFSPNVLFRPVYQEFALPNLAYIGGGGELAYWFELKNVFKKCGITFPVLVLRNSFLLIDSKMWGKWEKLGFDYQDLFVPSHQLEKSFALKEQDDDLSILEDKQAILRSFERISEKSKMINPSMVQFTESEKRKLEKSIDTIEKKLVRAEKKKNETSINQIRSIKESLFPGGGLQERKENVSQHYLKIGSTLIPKILSETDPLDLRLTILIY